MNESINLTKMNIDQRQNIERILLKKEMIRLSRIEYIKIGKVVVPNRHEGVNFILFYLASKYSSLSILLAKIDIIIDILSLESNIFILTEIRYDF
jgi:hypothetical protein